MEPILKWAGGKRQLLSELRSIITDDNLHDHTYFEPFIGGGCLAFSLENNKTVINDYNSELINVYKIIRDEPEKLIKLLKNHQKMHSRDYYYEVRSWDRSVNYNRLSDVKKASRIIYLNKTCYNGLYRVNSKGHLNVPLGRSKKMPDVVMEDKIKQMSEYLNQDGIIIMNGDFEDCILNAKAGDVIYLDPPYDYDDFGFNAYMTQVFSHDDLIRLKKTCDTLVDRGCKVIISNNDTNFVRNLFEDSRYRIQEIITNRLINCDGSNRKEAKEVIIYAV